MGKETPTPPAEASLPASAIVRQRVWRLGLALTALCPLVVLGASRFVYSLIYRDSDFFTFWLAARMQWMGQDPYTPAQWLGGHAQF
jgi:hypothetical protein